MLKASHILSFATDSDGQLFIHADIEGVDHLNRSLTNPRQKLAQGVCEHDHLMTETWGGGGLTEHTLEKDVQTIHHVKIYGWTPEWVQKHGLSA